MRPWRTRLRIRRSTIQLMVKSKQGRVVLKAFFPMLPDHPRAMLTLLEGLALFQGEPICAVIDADVFVDHCCGLGPFGEEWPTTSALVHYDFVESTLPMFDEKAWPLGRSS